MDAIIGKLKEGLQRKRDLDAAIARSENENTPSLQARANRLSEDILHSKRSKAQQSIMDDMIAGVEPNDEVAWLSLSWQFKESKAGRKSQKQWAEMDKLLKAIAESGDPHGLDAHSNRRDDLYRELARTKRSNVDLYGQLHEAALRTLVRQFAEQMNLPTKTPKQMGRRNAAVGSAARAYAPGMVERQLEEAGIDGAISWTWRLHGVGAR